MRRTVSLAVFFFLAVLPLKALTLTDATVFLVDIFSPFVDENEGSTSFRSLLIPSGGRAESMGGAFTGLADDISYINYNASASSLLSNSQASVFHNSWIADSNIETLSATTRLGNAGFGAAFSCFYVPFTEYDIFGTRASNGYYTESIACINASYNFLSGYNFKGLALGINLKSAFRGIPDYADDDTGEIITGSGFAQSAIAFMGDIGMMIRFNLAKFYASREPNVRIGFSVQNLGAAITNFGNGICLDAPLPSSVTAGFSYNFIKPIIISVDFRQPFALSKDMGYQMFQVGAGIEAQITDFFAAMAGFQLKGANPRFSFGAEFEINKIRVNANYTLDLTSSLNPLNRISISAKFIMGDGGRAEKIQKIDELYNLGVLYFSRGEYNDAIDVWEQVLELDKRFDPAILGIQSANRMLEMFQKIRDSMFLE